MAATLFPVHAELTGSKAEFIRGIFEGFMLGDGALDAKLLLNTIASKGYIPVVRRGLTSLRGYGACNESLYAYRCVGRESTKIRITLKIIICHLKIMAR